MTIRDLQPANVFAIFDEINHVPRPSKHEEKIRQYLLDFAAKHNIEAVTDKIGNVVMRVPGTPGHENAPVVALQAHMDMVCESNDKSFDFANSPITTIVDGDWLRADGTTKCQICPHCQIEAVLPCLQDFPLTPVSYSGVPDRHSNRPFPRRKCPHAPLILPNLQ